MFFLGPNNNTQSETSNATENGWTYPHFWVWTKNSNTFGVVDPKGLNKQFFFFLLGTKTNTTSLVTTCLSFFFLMDPIN